MASPRILIVEDSPTQAALLQSLLQDHHYDAVTCGNGEEALAFLADNTVEIVISDIMMPGMTGYELCNRLKSQRATADVPVILLTSLRDPMDVIRGLECGADNFLTKPYQDVQLLERVFHVLENRRLRDSRLQVGLTVTFLGQRFTVTADKGQILDLLVSTFEDAVIQNRKLLQREEELERAKAELQRYAGALEERIERVLDSVPDIVYSISADGSELHYISPACEALLGISPKEFAGNPSELWNSAIVPEHRARVRAAYDRVMRLGSRSMVEYEVVGRDGVRRWLEATMVPAVDDSGNMMRLDGIARDITRRRNLEDQLRLAQKMEAVGTLAGGIAHDFNNLLTAIRGNAELALMEIPEGTTVREDLSQISALVERATGVTRQLLALGRKQILEPRAIELNEIIDNASKMLRRFIGADIDLRIIPTEEPTTIWADPTQIDQVLMNLTLNSRHAMPDGGELLIETERVTLDDNFKESHSFANPGEYVRLTITDTGTGMSPETLSHIFEPFFTTKQPGEGTGLGMAVVYGIVKQHDGLIHAYSELGHGTSFKIYFPIHDVDAVTHTEESDFQLAGGNGETILFVEDEESVRSMAVKQLRRLGYEVIEATNGAEAIDIMIARDGNVDLVMLDMVMPVMGGPQAYGEIVLRFPSVKIMHMTGYSPSASHLKLLSEMDGHILQKPFGLTELAIAVSNVLAEQ